MQLQKDFSPIVSSNPELDKQLQYNTVLSIFTLTTLKAMTE